MALCLNIARYRNSKNYSIHINSLILNADGLDSIADALVSFIVWFSISMLQKPKSKLFHFGYAKIERFAAFVAAIVIVVSGYCVSRLHMVKSGKQTFHLSEFLL
jgi:divalent metal cation (Fe/Co/Zn/Cd) transporter